MRILFIGAHFPRPNNPTNGTWALSQVQALAAAGHAVEVISPVPMIPGWMSRALNRGTSAACPARYRWGNIDTHYVRWSVFPVSPLGPWLRNYPGLLVPPAYAVAARRFRQVARTFAPDVIFAHHGLLGGYIASRLARELRVPFLITEHDFEEVDSLMKQPARRRYFRRVTRGVAQWIAVADRLREGMRRVFPDVPSVTVHNGATTLDAARGTVRPQHLAGQIIVLCVSFLYRRKNVPLLIRAFDAACATNPQALLVVIGEGDDQPAVNAAAAQMRHPGQVKLLGSQLHGDVLTWMSWCDVFANIGADEPFATVFTEAMMCGKPIVYAADGGITDVVQSDVHGLAVTPNDEASATAALSRLISDARARARLGLAARSLSQTLTWADNATRMIGLFDAARRQSGADQAAVGRT